MAQHVRSTIFRRFRKEIKLTDHLDKNEEDNTDAESDHDCLFNDMAEEINELDCCFEEINPHEDFVEHEGDTRDVPDNTEQNKESQWRPTTTGKKKFKIHITSKDWRKIAPKEGQLKLRTPWTHIIYKQFKKIKPSCPIAFKYQRVRCLHSRKHGPYMKLKAVYTFSDCKAKYAFTCNEPTQQKNDILCHPIWVCQTCKRRTKIP